MPNAHAARPAHPGRNRSALTPATRSILALFLILAWGVPGAAGGQPSRNDRQPRQGSAEPVARSRTDEAARVLNGANGLLGRGLFDLAATEYEKFLAQAPDHAEASTAHYGLAVCLQRLGRVDEALEHLEPLTRVRGFQFAAEVDLLIGSCRMARGEFAEAGVALRRMRSASPNHPSGPDAAAMLVECLSRTGEHEQTAREARQFAQAWPDSPLRERTDLFLGVAEINRGRDEQAQRVLESTLERFPAGPLADQAMLLVAQCRHRRGLLGEAADAYRAVADRVRGPMAADALLGLGLIALSEQRLDDAATALDTLMREHPDAPCIDMATVTRARISLEQGDTRTARASLESLDRRAPDDLKDDTAYWLAKCDMRDDRHEDAASRLREASRRYPQSELAPEIAYDTAVALVRAGSDQEAGRALDSFEAIFPGHALTPDVVATRAGILHRMGDYDASLALCERFVREAPTSPRVPEIEFLAAENRYLDGQFARAERAYRQFLEHHRAAEEAATPGLARSAAYRLAMCVYRQGRASDAEPLLSEIAGLSPLPMEYSGAILALGDVRFQQERWGEAAAALARYLDLGPSVGSRDDALMKLGLSHARQGRHDAALAAFDELRSRHPSSVHALQARFEMGQCLLALGHDDEAKGAFEEVLDADPTSRFAPHALLNLGTIARRQGRHEEAASLLARAGEAGGGGLAAEADLLRGEALMGGDDYAQAASVLASFTRDHPDHPRAIEALGRLVISLARAGDHAASIEAAGTLGRRASSLDAPTRHAMLYELAWAHRALAQTDDAARVLLALIEDNPGDALGAHAMLALGVIREEAGESEVAAGLFASALASGERAGEQSVVEQASYRLGASELATGRVDEAAARLEVFVARFRASDLRPSALLLRGEALLKAGQHDRASQSFESVIDDHPESEHVGPALLRLGEATATLQLWARSEGAFTAWIERVGESDATNDMWFQARFGLGWARENQGRFDEAIEQYAKVIAGHDGPTAARAQFQIGQCRFAQGRHAEAAAELLKVDILYAYPEWSAAALYEAGRCLMAAGRMSEAREQFEAVRTRFADSQWAALAAQRLADAAPARTPGR